MKNQALEDIKAFAVRRLTQEYGYCGVAEGTDAAFLNSGKDGENLTISLKDIKDEG